MEADRPCILTPACGPRVTVYLISISAGLVTSISYRPLYSFMVPVTQTFLSAYIVSAGCEKLPLFSARITMVKGELGYSAPRLMKVIFSRDFTPYTLLHTVTGSPTCALAESIEIVLWQKAVAEMKQATAKVIIFFIKGFVEKSKVNYSQPDLLKKFCLYFFLRIKDSNNYKRVFCSSHMPLFGSS